MGPIASSRHESLVLHLGPESSAADVEAVEVEAGYGAALRRAQGALREGRVADAEAEYRATLDGVRGTGSAIERVALLNLAGLCLLAHREYEALVLAARAETLLVGGGDPVGLAVARLHQATVLRGLEDWERLRRLLPTIHALLPHLPPDAARRVEASVRGDRAALAVHDRDGETALAEVEMAVRLAAGDPGFDARVAARLRAEALLAAGRPGEAAGVLESAIESEAEDGDAPDPGGACRARALLVRCRLAIEGLDAAVREADALVRVLERGGGADVAPGLRVRLASSVGRELLRAREEGTSAPEVDALARRAFDVAASAALERLAEIDRFVSASPEVASGELLAVLAEARDRAHAGRAELHEAFARLQARALAEGRPFAPILAESGGLTRVCAWCQRVETRDGRWLSVPQFLPLHAEGPVRLTHGVCPTCEPRLAAEIAAVRAKRDRP